MKEAKEDGRLLKGIHKTKEAEKRSDERIIGS